jgi:GT2 family glycosyltransferase
VIIPVWNGRQELPDCIAALRRQSGLTFEIIAVDNGSQDGSADLLAQSYPDVRLIRSPENLGFAAGCNLGLEAAQGDFFVLLNQDTVVYPGWLANLVTPLQDDPSLGITGSKALYPDGTLQHAGGWLDARGVGHHYGRGEADGGQHNRARDVDFVTGASLALARATWQTAGGLDPLYMPAYFEDVDWCYRVRQAGLRVRYVPDSVLLHKEQSALLDESYDAIYLAHRNRLRFVLKFWPLHKLVDEFMPAEQAWLNSLGWQGERIVAALHHAYLYQLVHLSSIVAARAATFGDRAEEIDGLAAVLISLRAVYPLRPANLTNPQPRDLAASAPTPPPSPWARMVDGVRRRWPKLSRAGLASPVTRQFAQLSNQQQLAEVLVEYIRETNRELTELAQEVRSLQARIDQDCTGQDHAEQDRSGPRG